MTRIIIRTGAIAYLFLCIVNGLIYGTDMFWGMLSIPVAFGLLSCVVLLSPPFLIYYFVRWIARREIARSMEEL